MRQPKPYFKQSHNAWYANIGPGKRPIKLAEGHENETQAWKKYHENMAGRQPVSAAIPVIDLARQFLAYHEAKSADATIAFYHRGLKSFTEYVGPKLKVCDLKPYHVYEWITKRHTTKRRAECLKGKKTEAGKPIYRITDTGEPTTDNFRRNMIRAVKACFKWAEDQEYIERSPIAKVKLPPARARGDEAYLMPEQWVQLVSAVKDKPFLEFLTVLKESGCRPLEARKVGAGQFDREGRCWVFSKDDSKVKTESRIVHLTDRVFEICQRLALKNPKGPMFRNWKGKPWTRNGLDWRCQRLSRKLGFRVTPYSVRHTFATEAILRGVDLQTIATLMGHTSGLQMLSKIYQHIKRRGDHLKAGLRQAVGQ